MMVISRVQFRLTGTSVTSCVICLGGGKPAPTTAIRPLQLTREGDDASQAVRQPVQSALEWRRRRRKTRQQRGREGGGGDPRRQSIETPPVLPSPGSSRTCRPKFWRKAKKLRKKKVQRHEKRPLSACCLTGTTTSSSFGLPTSTCASEPYWDGMELCELHIYPEEDQWPPDIDSRIAALNFGGDSVLFESFDPSVSTDSLDSQQLREQCTIRRDDFQLAFADSGHWQSGLNETGNITTWGRIRSAEPLEERTASAPDVTKTSVTTNTTTNRPTSLIANFVANNDTRFVDLNDNEIETTRETSSELDEAIRKDRWRRSTASQRSLPTRRTFADLEPPTSSGSGSGSSGTKTAPPPLEFLALNHEIPSLCESFTTSFRDVLMKTPKVEGLPGITDLDDMNLDNTPDSGISCSGPSHIEDWASLSVLLPKHVAQACSFFKSNAQLLVSTSSSITAAPHAPVVHKTSNCIDSACSNQRKLTEPCRTCYRIRRRLHPPLWAQTQTSKTFLCDCLSSVTESQIKATGTSNTRHCLRPKELSIIGMPVYAMKRALIERVVEGVAAVSRGECPDSLVASMTEVISDGLLGHVSCWQMIKTVTSKGPATKDIFTTVKQLSDSNKSETVCVEIFFERLIRENSLDCWLCYVVLKEKALQKLYKEDAFLVSASGEYRTLLWRMVDSLALLPILETRDTTSQVKSLHETGGASRLASDSRVPKSSSVPARLSVSAATTSRRVIRPSRIPLLSRRDNSSSRVSTSSATNSASLSSLLATSQLAYVVEPVHETSNFDLEKDEKVRVLSCRDGMARCCRVHPKALQLCTGIVPVDKLSFVKNAH